MPSPLAIDNILYTIFEQLDAASLARCLCVCRVFAESGRASLLWKRHVTERWHLWEVPTDRYCDWRKEFIERVQSDVRVEEQLQTIIHSARKQHSRISSLADDYRTKALDILFAIYRDSAKRSLTERYYAGRIIHRIKKRLTQDFWMAQPASGLNSLAAGPPPTAPTYIGLAVLASSVDPFAQADVQKDMQALANTFKATHLTTDNLSEFEKVQRLVEFLRLEQGFGAPEAYYDIHNSLIHSVLRNKRGIPLTLAVVFQAIAHLTNLLGVDIMSFPGHVVIRHTEPITDSRMYIDIFQPRTGLPKPRDQITAADIQSVRETCILTQEQCENQLVNRYGVAVQINPGPGMTPREVYARCMRNIINADTNSEICGREEYIRLRLMITKYSTALQMAVSYSASRYQLEDFCLKVAERYSPEDVDLFGHWVTSTYRINRIRRDDVMDRPKKPKIYNMMSARLVWPVGTIVVEPGQASCSVVIGWDITYPGETEEANVIHTLLHEDMRIEHVDIRPSLCEALDTFEAAERFCKMLEIGQYFSHFDSNQARFIANDILRLSYPKD